MLKKLIEEKNTEIFGIRTSKLQQNPLQRQEHVVLESYREDIDTLKKLMLK